MATEYNAKLERIYQLAQIPKQLTPEAKDHLIDVVVQYMQTHDKTTIDANVLDFILLYVYNESYKQAIQDVLNIIQSS